MRRTNEPPPSTPTPTPGSNEPAKPAAWLSSSQINALTTIAMQGLKRGDSPDDIEAAFVQWLEVNVSAELAARRIDTKEFATLLTIATILCAQAHKVGRLS